LTDGKVRGKWRCPKGPTPVTRAHGALSKE